MATFSEIYKKNKIISLEFFPPKKEENLARTENLMQELAEYDPAFMTVTYGAGGGTRSFSQRLVSYIQNKLKVSAVSHLTCVGHSKTEIKEILESLNEVGISHILALRGDPPKGESEFRMHPEGFSCARDLVTFINEFGKFSTAVAGYPEVHQDAESPEKDLAYLKSKVEAGSEVIITQLFFDPDVYFSFCEKAREIGIEKPIVPGVMPIQNVSQLERFTSMCGANIPSDLHMELKKIQDDQEKVIEFGTEYAIDQIKKLLAGGAPGVHLYTLNKSRQVLSILKEIR